MESTEMKPPSAKETAIHHVRRAYEVLVKLEFLISFMKLERSRSEQAFSLFSELLESFTTVMSILNLMQELPSDYLDCSRLPEKDTMVCVKRVKLEKDPDVRRQPNRYVVFHNFEGYDHIYYFQIQ
jgi:hypothetical protein